MEGGVHRSSVVVGRQDYLDRLRGVVGSVGAGKGRCVFLTGEGGIGKTRLLNETAAEARRRGLAVLIGRASIGPPLTFGVVAEALRSWLRSAGVEPCPPSVYDRGLQLILPEWPAAVPATGLTDSQLRLLAFEGFLHVARAIGSERAVLLVLDDLHAADPESLEAVRYLAGAGVAQVSVVAAARTAENPLADHLVETLARQGLAEIWPVEPLGASDVGDLLSALLGTRPPEEFAHEVLARADGVPLFVEEIVDAHRRAGSLVFEQNGVRWRGGPDVVPRTVAAMVATRLDRLTEPQRDVVTAVAVAGDAADFALLAAVSAQSPATVKSALAAAIDAGLLETVAGTVEFRHAVVGDAVRDHALPAVVREMHARAAAALAPAASGSDSALERVAVHLAAIEESDRASVTLTEAAGIARRGHALLRAESLAEQARALARSAPVIDAADDALAAVLAAQGRWSDALTVDQATAARSGYASDRWMRMARCALDGRLFDVARRLAEEADRVGAERSPFFDVTVGRLAFARGDTGTALACAARTLASEGRDAATACAALDLRARAMDLSGRREEAAAAWTEQQQVAADAGLTAERIRGLVSLAELELLGGQKPQRMYEAVEVARTAGALVEQVWAQLNLSIALSVQGDPVAGLAMADEAEELCRVHRLDLLPFVLMARLGAVHILGDPEFETLLAEARRLGAGTADAIVHTGGIAGDHYMQLGLYERAIIELRLVTETVLALPGSVPTDSPNQLVLALCGAGRREEAIAALEVAKRLPDHLRWYECRTTLAVAEAVLAGDASAVDEALRAAPERMPYGIALLRVLAAEILGGPNRVRWLREALDLYEAHDGHLAVDRVRGLLRDAGAPVPRRRRKDLVPSHLIGRGVTAREAEVLALVAEGMPNAAIAEKLYLSVRTVESHVSSLLSKFGVTSRAELATFWQQ